MLHSREQGPDTLSFKGIFKIRGSNGRQEFLMVAILFNCLCDSGKPTHTGLKHRDQPFLSSSDFLAGRKTAVGGTQKSVRHSFFLLDRELKRMR